MKKIYYLIYLLFFKNTPEDYRPYALFFPKLRASLVKRYLNECGKNLRVKKGAEIAPYCKVGHDSELGTRCMIQSNVEIGDNVKIYPNVYIGDNVKIGNDCFIFSGVKIYSETSINSIQ